MYFFLLIYHNYLLYLQEIQNKIYAVLSSFINYYTHRAQNLVKVSNMLYQLSYHDSNVIKFFLKSFINALILYIYSFFFFLWLSISSLTCSDAIVQDLSQFPGFFTFIRTLELFKLNSGFFAQFNLGKYSFKVMFLFDCMCS